MHQDSKHTVTAAAIAGPSAVVSASAVVVAAPTITTNSVTDSKTPLKTMKEPFPITRLDPKPSPSVGYANMSSVNMNTLLSSRLNRQIAPLKLSRPAVLGDHVVVATEDPDEKEHFLMIVDTKVMSDTKADPLVKWCQPTQHIRDIHWIQAGTIVVAADKFVQLYSVDYTGSFDVKCGLDGMSDPIHTDCIREMAVSPYSISKIVSVGFDKTLCHLDLMAQHNRCTRRYTLDEVVGSVRWDAWKGASTVSVTLDNGKFAMYDAREARDSPAVAFNTGKLDLFTHEHYCEYNFLFGYGDGEIRHIDIRVNTNNHGIESKVDPYVDCIGNITYNTAADPRNNSFVVTGLTDVSVWRHNSANSMTSESQIWSHTTASPNKSTNTTGFTAAASYINDTTIVVSNSAGYLELFNQKFVN